MAYDTYRSTNSNKQEVVQNLVTRSVRRAQQPALTGSSGTAFKYANREMRALPMRSVSKSYKWEKYSQFHKYFLRVVATGHLPTLTSNIAVP